MAQPHGYIDKGKGRLFLLVEFYGIVGSAVGVGIETGDKHHVVVGLRRGDSLIHLFNIGHGRDALIVDLKDDESCAQTLRLEGAGIDLLYLDAIFDTQFGECGRCHGLELCSRDPRSST